MGNLVGKVFDENRSKGIDYGIKVGAGECVWVAARSGEVLFVRIEAWEESIFINGLADLISC